MLNIIDVSTTLSFWGILEKEEILFITGSEIACVGGVLRGKWSPEWQ